MNCINEGLNHYQFLDGNIEENPGFVDSENGNYSISKNSPCYDAGTSYFVHNGITLVNLQSGDFLGSAPDIGSFEVESNSSVDRENKNPKKFSLLQNYPNPFNPSTTIKYKLDVDGFCNISVLNIKGEIVDVLVNRNQHSGEKTILWTPNNLPTGVYFVNLQKDNNVEIIKMLYLK